MQFFLGIILFTEQLPERAFLIDFSKIKKRLPLQRKNLNE